MIQKSFPLPTEHVQRFCNTILPSPPWWISKCLELGDAFGCWCFNSSVIVRKTNSWKQWPNSMQNWILIDRINDYIVFIYLGPHSPNFLNGTDGFITASYDQLSLQSPRSDNSPKQRAMWSKTCLYPTTCLTCLYNLYMSLSPQKKTSNNNKGQCQLRPKRVWMASTASYHLWRMIW